MAWTDTLRGKVHELELIASWASQVNLGRVRDHIRMATAEIQDEVARIETAEKEARSGSAQA